MLLLSLATLAAACAAPAAAPTATAAFDIDTSRAPSPPLSMLLDSFGSSHGATTLRATWR